MLVRAESRLLVLGLELALALHEQLVMAPQFAFRLLLRARLDERRGDGSEHHQHGSPGHGHRHRRVVDHRGAHDDGRIGDDHDGAHGREVQRADGEREHARRHPQCTGPLQTPVGQHGHGGEHHAERGGGDNKGNMPLQRSRHADGGHAGEVHGADAGADHGAAGEHIPLTATRREGEAGSRDGDGDHERHDGQRGVVVGGQSGVVGQHGHKMGGPDAATRAEARQEKPDQAAVEGVSRAAGAGGTRVDLEGGEGGNGAHDSRQQHQPIVVLRRQAGKYAIHKSPRALSSELNIKRGSRQG